MNLTELRNLLSAIDRADRTIELDKPEQAVSFLTLTEQELIRASIRSIMTERRANMIERLKKEKLNIEEVV